MNPEDYEKLAPFEELDHEPDSAQADAIEEGYTDDYGGELGRADWEDVLTM